MRLFCPGCKLFLGWLLRRDRVEPRIRGVRCSRCGRQTASGVWVGPSWFGAECMKYALAAVTESDEQYIQRKMDEQEKPR